MQCLVIVPWLDDQYFVHNAVEVCRLGFTRPTRLKLVGQLQPLLSVLLLSLKTTISYRRS